MEAASSVFMVWKKTAPTGEACRGAGEVPPTTVAGGSPDPFSRLRCQGRPPTDLRTDPGSGAQGQGLGPGARGLGPGPGPGARGPGPGAGAGGRGDIFWAGGARDPGDS